ncbi:MAG: alpha/beta hydrolase [Gammaproteobacteria bacterium]
MAATPETVTIQAAGNGPRLQAVWATGDGPALIIAPPHPLYGGSLDNPVVEALAAAASRAGRAHLRFNWRGVGASGGNASGDPAEAQADYRAALEDLAARVPGPFVAAGYSFGAATALTIAHADARVVRAVLIAPPAAMLSGIGVRAGLELRVVTGEHDEYAPPAALQAWLGTAAGASLESIAGADHFFSRGTAALGVALARALV